MTQTALAALAQAAQLLGQVNQLLGQAHSEVANAAAGAQVQQGLPQQQAFGNPGGMQGAQQNTGFGGTPAQNVAQQGLQGQQGALGQQFGGGFGANTGQQAITADTIQQLISPMVQNEQVKAALVQAMQQHGIQNLPDARPDQLPALYQAFKNIEQQALQAGLLGNGAAGGTQQAQQGGGII